MSPRLLALNPIFRQAALKRSEEEAAALASMPFEAVMSVSYMGGSAARASNVQQCSTR